MVNHIKVTIVPVQGVWVDFHLVGAVLECTYIIGCMCGPPCAAQRLGLVPVSHVPLLTETEWACVKGQSQARKDSDMPCAICREGFGLKEQVSGRGFVGGRGLV